MTALRARPETGFRRAYVQPMRRRWFARRAGFFMHVGLLAAIAASVISSWQFLRHAEILRIDTITVDGNRRLTPGEVAGLAGLLRGANLLATDLDAAQENLLASGWVREATLRRVLPAAVHVALVEREPIGLSRFGAHLYLIDGTGYVIDEFGPRFADLDLPVIDGLSADAGASAADRRRVALAARLLAEIGADSDLAGRLSQVDVSDAHDAVVLLDADPVRIHLGAEDFAGRLRTYLEIAPTLREEVPDIDYVDLRFGERVYVGRAGRTAAARRTARPHRGRAPAPMREYLSATLHGAMTGIGLRPEDGQRRQYGT